MEFDFVLSPLELFVLKFLLCFILKKLLDDFDDELEAKSSLLFRVAVLLFPLALLFDAFDESFEFATAAAAAAALWLLVSEECFNENKCLAVETIDCVVE